MTTVQHAIREDTSVVVVALSAADPGVVCICHARVIMMST